MASHPKLHPNIVLYRGFKDSGVYVWSPFVTKLEARLRFGGLPYRTETGSLSQAPKGKVPYIGVSADSDIQENASMSFLSDSTLIISKLVGNGELDDINAKLSPAEKAVDLAIQALLEEKLYFYQSYERWHENYYTMRCKILEALPYPVQIFVGLLAYRKITATLYGQGTMRFSGEELSAFRKQIWENINALLVEAKGKQIEKASGSDENFWVLGGNGPTEADAVLFGFIVSALVCTASPETRSVVKSFPTVVDYALRIHNRYFPDYTFWEE